jgi:hypothetical protein
MTETYTTQLGAGQGIVEETRILLDLWQKGTDAASLNKVALQSGRFQKLTARRLRNLILEGFAPRFLSNDDEPAIHLKALAKCLTGREFIQLLYSSTEA